MVAEFPGDVITRHDDLFFKGFPGCNVKLKQITKRLLVLAGASQILQPLFDWFEVAKLAHAKNMGTTLMGFLENPSQLYFRNWLQPNLPPKTKSYQVFHR